MEDRENFEYEQASLSEGGGTAVGGDGGSSSAQTTANETPSVTADAVPAPSEREPNPAPTAEKPVPEREPWYIDLNKDEFVAFRLLMARLMGPLRQRIPTLVVSLFCFVMLAGYAVFEWLAGWVVSPDPVLLVGAALVLIPTPVFAFYLPYRIRRMAEKQYDRSVESGMDFFGELVVYPDRIEKAGPVLTTGIRIDERLTFIETPDLMLFYSPQSPAAIVIPARCATDEMACAVREAMLPLPPYRRRFLGRIQPKGEPVTPPPPKAKPEELWVATFTYTAEEYTAMLKTIIQQHFWRMAPLLAVTSMMGALAFGYDGESLVPCIGYFVAFMALLILVNLVLPLSRIKRQVESLSAHDTTVQVRMDTMALHLKLPKGAQNMVLWCDVDHVYEREDSVEIVHNKHASLYIPKRCIDDLDALDAVIQRCRGEHKV